MTYKRASILRTLVFALPWCRQGSIDCRQPSMSVSPADAPCGPHEETGKMGEAAARLRAQKAYSTDPQYLERMAVQEEAREDIIPRSKNDWQAVTSGNRLDRPIAPSGPASATD